ncbi:MAG TPA: serine hydrolase [Flavobacteriaceae bacterium]|nr:serine hydrolase [Flavobacteriaceae bacterium]
MRHFLFFSFFLFSIINSYAQKWTVELDSVLTLLAREEMFHGQVLIVEKGQVVFHKAYGTLPNQNQQPITAHTPLAVKSITKGFTAMATLKLAQEGKLNLSDKVQAYFPDWPYKGITIKQLLSMTSGLPDFITKAIQVGDTAKYMTNQDIVKLVSENPIEVRRPGHVYDYKNSNYITLAALIEKVSGQSYSKYIIQNIIKPLGLKNTYLEDLTSHTKNVNADNFYAPYGDGNLHSTATDLYRFEQSFYGNEILSQASIDSTFTKTTLADGTLSKYGLGWWIIDEPDHREYYILGDGPNIRASIQRYPDTQSTLIYIHNFSGRYWHDVYWAVRNIWLGNKYTMPTKNEISEYNIDKELYAKYVGSYVSKGFGLLHITVEEGKLYVRPDPIPGKELLIPSSDTTFYFSDKSVEWEFFLNDDGSVKGFGFKGKPESMGIKQ